MTTPCCALPVCLFIDNEYCYTWGKNVVVWGLKFLYSVSHWAESWLGSVQSKASMAHPFWRCGTCSFNWVVWKRNIPIIWKSSSWNGSDCSRIAPFLLVIWSGTNFSVFALMKQSKACSSLKFFCPVLIEEKISAKLKFLSFDLSNYLYQLTSETKHLIHSTLSK